MMYYYGDDFDRMVKAERKGSKKCKDMSGREWLFNDCGSAAPHACSMDTIFSAYRDYRASQQWN